MISINLSRWRPLAPIFAVLLLVSAPPARAAVPSGNISLSFTNTGFPIWDFSGDMLFEQDMQGPGNGSGTPLIFGFTLTNDASGLLHSAGTGGITVGNDFVAGNYRVTGRVSGPSDDPRVDLVVKIRGDDAITGITTPFVITIVYHLRIDPEAGALVGTARGMASFGRLGSSPINTAVTIPLPTGMDGSWALNLNILALSRLTGNAQILLSNGRTIQARLSGVYSRRLDVSRIHLSASAPDKGASLTINLLTIEGGSETVSMRGVILGQRVRQ